VGAAITYTGDQDWFGVSATGGPLTVQLIGMNADLDMELRDADGNLVASAALSGNRSESVAADLVAGHYFARVFAKDGTSTSKYRLNIK
jgi:hypothetical protein